MPAPPTSLSLSERRAFASWLRRVKDSNNISTRSVGLALGRNEATNRQVNAYFDGRVFPMPDVLIRIAGALSLPPLHVLSFAGYKSELIRPIESLFKLGLQWAEEDGYSVNHDLWVNPGNKPIHVCRYAPLKIDSKFLRLKKPNRFAEETLTYSIPMLNSIWAAVGLFHRYSDEPRRYHRHMDWTFATPTILEEASRVKPRKTKGSEHLEKARDLLLNSRLSQHTAYAAASELVREWAALNAPLLTAFAEVVHFSNDGYAIDASHCDAEKLDFRLRHGIDHVCRHEHPEYFDSLTLGVKGEEEDDAGAQDEEGDAAS